MRQAILALVIILAVASTANARWCNSPHCAMCARAFGPLQTTVTVVAVPQAAPAIESTPQAAVEVMLAQLDLIPGDVLYDLGCGDGRVLITAVKLYGCRGLGIEIDPAVAQYARQRVQKAGCGRIRIMTGDARKFKLDQATAVTMYLMPPLMAELMPKIRTKRVVTFAHPIPDTRYRQVLIDRTTSVYVLEGEQ